MRTVLAILITLAGCSLYSDDSPALDAGTEANPVAQCRELVRLFCVAAEECGWDDNAGPCRDYYGAMCERNETRVSEETMYLSRFTLSSYECAQNEAWIVFPNERGRHVLDAMLAWPEAPTSD